MTAPHASAGAIVRQLFHHAWPILVAQLLSMAMMIADTLIAGRYGTLDLAGVAIGSSFYISVVMLLGGILQAVAPTVAHHVGAGRTGEIGPALQQGFWLAAMLALPGVAVLLAPGPLLALAEVPPDVAELASRYLAATAAGLPALLFYRSFYAFNNAVGRPRALMAISAIVTSVHLPLAWALTNGAAGLSGIPQYADWNWVFGLTAVTLIVLWNYIRSSHGRRAIAVREDEIAAEAIGVNTTATKVQAFTIGAFFAGIGGGLYASYFFLIKPDQFGFLRSIDILVIVVLGGLGSLSGTVIAAILLAIVSMLLAQFSDIRMILYSLMLVLIMIFRPGGIMGSKEVTDTVLGKIFTRKGAKR